MERLASPSARLASLILKTLFRTIVLIRSDLRRSISALAILICTRGGLWSAKKSILRLSDQSSNPSWDCPQDTQKILSLTKRSSQERLRVLRTAGSTKKTPSRTIKDSLGRPCCFLQLACSTIWATRRCRSLPSLIKSTLTRVLETISKFPRSLWPRMVYN